MRSHLFLILLAVLSISRVGWSAECTMRAAPIDLKRIAHDKSIKSYVVDVRGQSITALLKNGRALKLTHSGCDHSGATAALWLDSDLALSDTTDWIKEANALVRIAFAREIAADISDSLLGGQFEKSGTEARVVLRVSPSSFMSYSVVISAAERGVLLTITYELG